MNRITSEEYFRALKERQHVEEHLRQKQNEDMLHEAPSSANPPFPSDLSCIMKRSAREKDISSRLYLIDKMVRKMMKDENFFIQPHEAPTSTREGNEEARSQ